MPANSLPRRFLKRIIRPVFNDNFYRYCQCLAMAWDIRTGIWYEPELKLIPHAVQPGDNVIDIGANYGLYTYHLSKRVGDSGRVYAFEPIPFTFSTLTAVAKLLRFKRVELIAKGCDEKEGEAAFTIPIQDSGAIAAGLAHSARRDNERSGKEIHARYQKTKQIHCQVVTIDGYLADLKSVSFIKCDIEGADAFALRGAQKTIEKHHPTIVCEINPWFLEGYHINVKDFLGFFMDRGYKMYRYVEKGPETGRFQPVLIQDIVEDNYVFIHPERHDRVASVLA